MSAIIGVNSQTGRGVTGAAGTSAASCSHAAGVCADGESGAYGVWAYSSTASGVIGLAGVSSPSKTNAAGLYGEGGNYGVLGVASGEGVWGYSTSGTGTWGSSSGSGWGVWGYNTTSGGYAGYFSGDITVTGKITAGTKDFLIDHPLNPGEKYLYHASVESSEMMNIYTGNVQLDPSGEAVVELPEWFEAVNTDFRYQLTAIGAPAPGLYIAEEIANHQFKIAGGRPGMKVSWQVTGVRQDAFAKAHPLQVEVDKPENERGYYIHPELYGAPPEKSMEWASHPDAMREMREMRQKEKETEAAGAQRRHLRPLNRGLTLR